MGGDTIDNADVFVHDRETKETKRVSVGSNGAQANEGSNVPAISGNGRFVGFDSGATNLVAGDTNGTPTTTYPASSSPAFIRSMIESPSPISHSSSHTLCPASRNRSARRTFKPAQLDCWIGSGSVANSSNCGSASDFIRVGRTSGGDKRRGLIKFNLTSIPSNATVNSADLALFLDTSKSTNPGAVDDYFLRRVEDSPDRPWNNSATWNKYDGVSPWSTPGGDFGTVNAGLITVGGAGSSGYRHFDPTSLVSHWVTGTYKNRGVILKQAGENTNNTLYFASSGHADSGKHPKLTVNYAEPSAPTFEGIGERRFYKFESQRLSDKMEAKVNVATGNLVLKESDLSIAGTGVGLTLDRYYNSLTTAADPAKLGPGWLFGTGASVRLEFPTSGRVVFVGPSGYRVRFDKNADGDFLRAEPGLDAELRFESPNYVLDWHSKEKYVFNSGGRFTEHKDKNGNKLTFAYNADNTLQKITDTRNRVVNFAYNGGLLDTVTDVAGGRTYDYNYEATGDLTHPFRLSSYAVTSYGLEADQVNLNKLTRFGYDSSHRLTSVTDPRGNRTTIAYDATRRVTSITRVTTDATDVDPKTTFTYFSTTDGCKDTGESAEPVGKTVVDGPRTDVSDTTTHCFDKHDRVVKTIDAKGHKASSKYTSNSNVAELNESGVVGGPAFGYTFQNDNMTGIDLPTGGQASMGYGDTLNPHFPTALRDFSNNKSGANSTWNYDYDDDGNLIEAKSTSPDITFRYCYNADGTVDRVAPPAPGGGPNPAPLDTNTSGTACSGTAQGNDTLFSYNTKGELTKVDPPGSHATQSFTYDALSRVETVKDGRGVVTEFSYDALDRITDIDYSFTSSSAAASSAFSTLELIPPDDPPDDGSSSTQRTWINYSYDENGNLTARSDSSGNTVFFFDELNRMTKEAPEQPSAVTNYSYDAAGNVKSIEASDEPRAVTYSYDNTNLVTTVVDQEARTTGFEYNKHGLRRKTSYPGGVIQESRYDDSERMKCIYAYKGTAPSGAAEENCPSAAASLLTYFRYSYTDTVGGVSGVDTNRREQLTERDSSVTTYDYDDISRLTAATTKASTTTTRKHAYSYDALGNPTKEIVSGTVAGNATTTQAYDDAGELCWSAAGSFTSNCATKPTGAKSYSYDGAGNLASVTSGPSASYSLRGHMVEITPPGGAAIDMKYTDATQDRRILAGNTRMAYNQLGLSSQGTTSSASNATWFVRDPEGTLVGMLNASTLEADLYYLFDGLGSVAATTNASGTLVKRYSYEPYGQEISPVSGDANPWRYASGYFDKATGMLKFGTRYYMPDVMRWTQRDPVSGQSSDPMSLNPYAYVGGNPINVNDPTGRFFHDEVLQFAAGFVEGIVGGFGYAVALAGVAGGIAFAACGGPFTGVGYVCAGYGLVIWLRCSFRWLSGVQHLYRREKRLRGRVGGFMDWPPREAIERVDSWSKKRLRQSRWFFAWIMLSVVTAAVGSLVILIAASTWTIRVIFAVLFLSYLAAAIFVLDRRNRAMREGDSKPT